MSSPKPKPVGGTELRVIIRVSWHRVGLRWRTITLKSILQGDEELEGLFIRGDTNVNH